MNSRYFYPPSYLQTRGLSQQGRRRADLGRDVEPVRAEPELAHGEREQRALGRHGAPLHRQPGPDHQGLAAPGRHALQDAPGDQGC